jgi:hypothetical protein
MLELVWIGEPMGWRGLADQVKPTFRTKCPALRWSTAPPAQCTMDASKMMARITTTTQKKNTTMPGMAYPATVLALATATSYPPPLSLFGRCLGKASHSQSWTSADGSEASSQRKSPRSAASDEIRREDCVPRRTAVSGPGGVHGR